ncbi:MAG TPA: hypothetical protein VK627_00430, partial [Edaphobacter sp.]|nr:hypothetical protein [Edaphobacter sp.]
MLFRSLAELAEALAGEAGRLKKRAAIAEAILQAHQQNAGGEDAGLFAMYVAGTPFAEADARKLNAGGALLTKALLAVSGASGVALTAAYRRHGDLGAAGFDLLGGSVGAVGSVDGLTLVDVAEAFAAMAVARTTAIRAGLVEGLLRRASALEAKYLLKLMLGDMRIGVKQSLVEEAIAVAAGVPVGSVRQAVMLEADLGGAVRRAFEGTIGEARMRLFHPLGFMLASPVETPEEAVARFTEKPAVVKAVKKGRKKKGVEVEQAEEMEVGTEAVAKATATAGPSSASLAEGTNDSAQDDNVLSLQEDDASLRESAKVEAFLEDKYDGMRAQVHCGDAEQPGRVAIYSRNREDVTASFPELEEAFARVRPEVDGALIFDGE